MEQESRLLQKISQLERYISKFSIVVPEDLVKYQQSEVHRYATERLLQVTIEIVLDICSLLIRTLHLGPPTSEEQILDLLLPYIKSIPHIKEMKKFRNRLVHRYDDLNENLIYELATTENNDFQQFLDEVKSILDNIDKIKK